MKASMQTRQALTDLYTVRPAFVQLGRRHLCKGVGGQFKKSRCKEKIGGHKPDDSSSGYFVDANFSFACLLVAA